MMSVFSQSANEIVGTWLNEEKDAKISVYQSGDKYFGKIVWSKSAYEADGKTLKKDSKNSDVGLRSKTLQNLVILSGFSYKDNEWTYGKIYDPKTGKTYSAKMKLKGNNLQIRAFVGMATFGKTTVWTKTN